MKAREPRRNVMLNARVRVSARWNDACILNISKGGLMMQAPEPPVRGTYLDVHRGPQAIVARVVWVEGQRFGVCTQDPLAVEELINPSATSNAQLAASITAEAALERRASPRVTAARHEASRTLSRSMEFVFVGLFGAAVAVTAFSSVQQTLGRPFAQVSASLAPR